MIYKEKTSKFEGRFINKFLRHSGIMIPKKLICRFFLNLDMFYLSSIGTTAKSFLKIHHRKLEII